MLTTLGFSFNISSTSLLIIHYYGVLGGIANLLPLKKKSLAHVVL